ncbi:hypothetical protein KY285_027588 [Solanum tuberosum]|nr:hypothetical protein KY285_027588 [Solanum tuberosum]
MPQVTINFKHTWLQELCHQIAWNLPEYATEKDGPDHNPRFKATVTVNGVSFELPKDQWRSSKEAQNHAAHIAYDHFIVPQSIPLLTPQPSLLPTSSDVRWVINLQIWIFFSKDRITLDNFLMSMELHWLASVDTNTPKGMLHLYKNRLQHCPEAKSHFTRVFF